MCGAGLGGATVTLAQILVRVMRGRMDLETYQQAAADPLLAGLLAGLVIAVVFGWRRGRPLENGWQQGVIAVLAAGAALILGFLAAVADQLLGMAGLCLWAAVNATAGVVSGRWAIKGSGDGKRETGDVHP